MAISPPKRRGRPPLRDPAKTYKGLTYVICTFRLGKRSVAEADVISEALALGTRTNAVQYAIGQVFRDLHRTASMTRSELDRNMRGRLKKLGG